MTFDDMSAAVKERAKDLIVRTSEQGTTSAERQAALAWLEGSSVRPSTAATPANTDVPRDETRDESGDLQQVDSTRCKRPSGSHQSNGETACGTPERGDGRSQPVRECRELQRIRRRLLLARTLLEGQATDLSAALADLLIDIEATVDQLARCSTAREAASNTNVVQS